MSDASTSNIEVRLTHDVNGEPLARPVVFYVEAESDGGEGEVSNRLVDSLQQVLDAIRAVSGQIAGAVHDLGPDKYTVKLGFQMKAEAGGLVAILVRSGGSASVEVTLEWQRQRAAPAAPGG